MMIDLVDQARRGGWAYGEAPRTEKLSYVPLGPDDDEPAWTPADCWVPPHPLALPEATGARIKDAAVQVPVSNSGNGDYYWPFELDPDDHAAIVDRMDMANAAWWNLDVDTYTYGVKRYRPGRAELAAHEPHQDLYATRARRKLAGVVQLSHPADYAGGQLVIRLGNYRIAMPPEPGTLAVFPGFTVHEVTPVTRGERWSLCIFGWGPPLR